MVVAGSGDESGPNNVDWTSAGWKMTLGGPCEAKSLGRLWRGEGSLCVIGRADMCPVRF